MEDADLIALRKNNQKLQVENDDLLTRHAGDKKLQMETLLKLFSKKKRTTGLERGGKKLTIKRAESRSEQEMVVGSNESTEDAVATKLVAENVFWS